MAGLKLTPIILKEVNRYLTSPKKVRKFGFDQPPVKTGKDIKIIGIKTQSGFDTLSAGSQS